MQQLHNTCLHDNEIVVDNFAGGGGASTGVEIGLSRHVDIAINHDADAIDMHKMNHPEATHYCESVWDVDPIDACQGRPVGLGWFSPDCKHFSKAKGSVPLNKNIRGLAWIVVKWAALVPMRIFMLENVEEFKTWGPLIDNKPDKERSGLYFDGFLLALTTGLPAAHPAFKDAYRALFRCNYDLQTKLSIYKAMRRGLGYNVEHNQLRACDYGAPTIRKRLFMIGRNDQSPIVWPEPTHGDGLKPYKTASDIIDWELAPRSIFNRKRLLAENTMCRLGKGMRKFVFVDSPYFAPQAAAVPFVTEHANASSQRNMAINEPLRTICAQVKGGHFAVVSAFIAKHYTGVYGSSAQEPLHTVTQKDHNALVSTSLFNASDMKGRYAHPLRKTVIAFLQTYAGLQGDNCDLFVVDGTLYQVRDIGMRMLEPYELFAAQGFPESYIFSVDKHNKPLSKVKQVARCGNAVCPPVATALARANVTLPPVLSVAA